MIGRDADASGEQGTLRRRSSFMNTQIESLGPGTLKSPLHRHGPAAVRYRTERDRVLADDSLAGFAAAREAGGEPLSFEIAGPREHIFFDPARTTAGIVTCGGLCPGLNDVIKGLVMELYHRYGVQRIFGFRYGYEGLIPSFGHVPMSLRPDKISEIHHFGGTILGSSRGPQDIGAMIDTLEEMSVDLLFVIGGDGTLRGANELAHEIKRRGLRKAVVGIPKTIDNDITHLDKCFGFETAFAEAVKALQCAHVEAVGATNGVGLVKLMGRDSGFIACYASLASSLVNFTLIPEVPFELEGPRGLLEALRYRLAQRHHAVIVVAEGAGQHLLAQAGHTHDASGNALHGDIGLFLRDRIGAFFAGRKMEATVKFIDPSYTIRSVPASPQDNVFCSRLAQNAVHAAMAGKTAMLVGRWHGSFVHLPLELVTNGRRRVDPRGELWHSVLETTGQPAELY